MHALTRCALLAATMAAATIVHGQAPAPPPGPAAEEARVLAAEDAYAAAETARDPP